MAPDLNSLPPSSTTGSISRSASTSLQATAAVNAGLQHESPRRISTSSASRGRQSGSTARRRSAVLMNLQLNDPAIPAPGEMQSTHDGLNPASPVSLSHSPTAMGGESRHFRAPSLGEMHQEIEQEQEAQVNRLLAMIRAQQQQLQQLQTAGGQPQGASLAIEDSTPTSERSMSFSHVTNPQSSSLPATSMPRSPSVSLRHRGSADISRVESQRRSRTSSQHASPRLRAASNSGEGQDTWLNSGRDECAFYQAETQMMTRENQMLKQRICELERQINELHVAPPNAHEPATQTQLVESVAVPEASDTHT